MPKKDEKALAVTVASGAGELEASLSGVVLPLSDVDYDETQHEEPKLRFVGLRQKDLRDRDGRIVREAGRFRTGKVSDLSYDDREELYVTVLAFTPGLVYFRDLNQVEPTCKSIDMKSGSRPREVVDGKQYFGACETCHLGQWGSGGPKRKACRENRSIFAFDWGAEAPVVLRIGVSSLAPWQAYDEHVTGIARRHFAKGGKVPFIHHMIAVKVGVEYRAEPAGHYVVRFAEPVTLPRDRQVAMAEFRAKALSDFRDAVERADVEAEDYVGPSQEAQFDNAAMAAGSADSGPDGLPF